MLGVVPLEDVQVIRQGLLGAPGPVLAYCRSGARSTTLWALAQAGAGLISVDQILSAARAAGYDLDQHRPLLESLAGQG